MTLLEQLEQQLKTICHQAFPDLPNFVPEIRRPTQTGIADFSSSAALMLFGQLSPTAKANFSTPTALAEFLKQQLEKIKLDSNSVFKNLEITVASPGFINFILPPAHYLQLLNSLKQTSKLLTQTTKPQKYLVEYSSPNIAKPFTVGHLRSTIIGQSIANLLKAAGHQVFRDNHVGDWGTQFGKQIYAIKTWGNETELDQSQNPAKELVTLYVKFHQAAETDSTLEDAARAWFQKLETGDPEARRLWQKCIDWSWKEFDRIYQKLEVTFTENKGRGYGESFFETQMAAVVAEIKAKKLLTSSQGAELVFFPNDQFPPLMITKKDGSSLYSTRDLATDKFRLSHDGKDVIIINEVGAEQQLYFQQLFALEQLLGWVKPNQRIHIKHGLIRFKTGKMSTRKGNVVWLDEVLTEAFARTQTIAGQRLIETELWKIALGAIKWNDLKRNCEQPISFDWNEVLRLEGNSGPYLQYAYTRCLSVLTQVKANQDLEILTWPETATDQDLNLLKKIIQYDESVMRATEHLAPHFVCTYLFELAQTFNSWYANHSVLKAPTPQLQNLRWQLVKLVARVLKEGLELLGIAVLEKM